MALFTKQTDAGLADSVCCGGTVYRFFCPLDITKPPERQQMLKQYTRQPPQYGQYILILCSLQFIACFHQRWV